jgi:antitoxin CptB
MSNQPVPDIRRRRILYRATHRGTKEADAIIGGFFSQALPVMSDDKLEEAEALIEELDLDLLDWIMERAPIPTRWRNTMFDDVITFYIQMGGTKS